jgi:hypothetical protein
MLFAGIFIIKATDRVKFCNERLKHRIITLNIVKNRYIPDKHAITSRNRYRKDRVEYNMCSYEIIFLDKTCFLIVL